MKFLIKEQISPHRYKTPEGYLVCVDAVLARTGKQEYRKNEIYDCNDEDIIEINRREEDVFSPETIASFENKPVTWDHPDTDVNPENHRDLAVGYVRDVHKGEDNGQPVIMGNLIITDAEVIEAIENGDHCELSCGYSCDITDDDDPRQINIRGNHVALCEHGRAGNARIVDSKINDDYMERHYYAAPIRTREELIEKVREINLNEAERELRHENIECVVYSYGTYDAWYFTLDVWQTKYRYDVGYKNIRIKNVVDNKSVDVKSKLINIIKSANVKDSKMKDVNDLRIVEFLGNNHLVKKLRGLNHNKIGTIRQVLKEEQDFNPKLTDEELKEIARRLKVDVKDFANDIDEASGRRSEEMNKINDKKNWEYSDELQRILENAGFDTYSEYSSPGYRGPAFVWITVEDGDINRALRIAKAYANKISEKYFQVEAINQGKEIILKVKDSIDDARWGNNKVLTKEDAIRELKTARIKEDENWDAGDEQRGWYVQIQNHVLTELEVNTKTWHTSSKEKSAAWGRIWKDGKFMFKEDGPLNVVRQNMIRFIQSSQIDDSEMDDDRTTTRRVFRESDIGEEGSYLGTTEWGTPKGSLYVYKKNGKIIAEAEGVAVGDPKGTFEFNSLKDLNRWLLKDSKMKDSTDDDYYHKIDNWVKKKYPDYDWEVERIGYIRIYDPHTSKIIKSSIPTSSILKDSISDEKIIKIAKIFKIMKK